MEAAATPSIHGIDETYTEAAHPLSGALNELTVFVPGLRVTLAGDDSLVLTSETPFALRRAQQRLLVECPCDYALEQGDHALLLAKSERYTLRYTNRCGEAEFQAQHQARDDELSAEHTRLLQNTHQRAINRSVIMTWARRQPTECIMPAMRDHGCVPRSDLSRLCENSPLQRSFVAHKTQYMAEHAQELDGEWAAMLRCARLWGAAGLADMAERAQRDVAEQERQWAEAPRHAHWVLWGAPCRLRFLNVRPGACVTLINATDTAWEVGNAGAVPPHDQKHVSRHCSCVVQKHELLQVVEAIYGRTVDNVTMFRPTLDAWNSLSPPGLDQEDLDHLALHPEAFAHFRTVLNNKASLPPVRVNAEPGCSYPLPLTGLVDCDKSSRPSLDVRAVLHDAATHTHDDDSDDYAGMPELVPQWPLVHRAAHYAEGKHAGQTRRDGTPYFRHCERVADNVAFYTADEEVIAAAFLHDTLEDTETTAADLEREFGARIAALVRALSNEPEALARMGKRAYLAAKINALDEDALLIKLADRLDNLRDLDESARSQQYGEQTRHVFYEVLDRSHLKSAHIALLIRIERRLAAAPRANPHAGLQAVDPALMERFIVAENHPTLSRPGCL